MLLEQPGNVVKRDEFRQKLWPNDTFVDFDHGLNNAINRLREALNDSADAPRFIETLPRRGYRFIAPVEPIASGTSPQVPLVPRSKSKHFPPGWRLAVIVVSAGILVVVASAVVTPKWRGIMFHKRSSVRQVKLAVLPFVNLSGDPAQEYFSDGMTEEMITQLSRIQPGRLGVIARTSAMLYKNVQKSTPQICHELGVDYILEGSVRLADNRARITAQLIQCGDQTHLWAESFEKDLRDILALQDDVSRAIVNGIQIRLTPQEQGRLANAHRVDPEAYQSYLRGLYFWNKLTPDSAGLAINYFQAAIKKDPGYAPAYASLANCYSIGYQLLDLTPREAYTPARTAATRAAALDENLAEAHVALGGVSEMGWDWSTAEHEFRRAIQLDPNQSYAHLSYGYLLLALHKPDDAWTELKTAQSLDPVSQVTGVAVVMSLNYSRRYDEAITATKQWLQLYPDSFLFHTFLGDTYVQKRTESPAVTEYLKAEELLGSGPSRIAALREASRTSGLSGFLRRKLALDQDPRSPRFSTFDVARDYAALRDRDNCLLWLEKSYNEKDLRLTELSLDPWFDGVRSDPRFLNLLRRIGLPP
jgi:TolB-like protein/tetratricopeptide (TPR) repeat protein